MFQPAYYLGRRVHVFHASSHPVTYVYMFVRQNNRPIGRMRDSRQFRLAHTSAFWQDRTRKVARTS